MKEEYFIKQFRSKFIGDDGAVIGDEVYASDSFFEDVHFKKEWLSLEEIGYKASLVNISDLIVMNAKPKYALLNVGFNDMSLSDIKKLSLGFNKAAKEFGYEIIGGDTIKTQKISISITLIGKTKKAVFRKAKTNQYVAFTGELGSVAKDLKRLFRGEKISKNSKFIKPKLKEKFFYKASKYITAACDISDGLFKELERISKHSNVDYKFLKRIDRFKGCSAEEYEILFTFDKRYLKAIKNIAKQTRTPIEVFAVTKRGKYKSICKEHHF